MARNLTVDDSTLHLNILKQTKNQHCICFMLQEMTDITKKLKAKASTFNLH